MDVSSSWNTMLNMIHKENHILDKIIQNMIIFSPPVRLHGGLKCIAFCLSIYDWTKIHFSGIPNSLCFSTWELRYLPKQWTHGPTLALMVRL